MLRQKQRRSTGKNIFLQSHFAHTAPLALPLGDVLQAKINFNDVSVKHVESVNLGNQALG